ncbi:ATP-binding protein [Streptomyces pilosus]|uniref:ATP-binding protein n=1 Tax=Streptomyces pilosus TaxID=28893 RepID=UPI003639774B
MPPSEARSTSLLEASPVQTGSIPLPAFSMAMRAAPESVEVVRRITRTWIRCHSRLPQARVDVLLIVVSELCTNAVVHGRGPSVEVRGCMQAPGQIRLEVHDGSPSAVPLPQHASPDSENGRGLLLIDALVSELSGCWGFTPDGTCAWFRLPVWEGE